MIMFKSLGALVISISLMLLSGCVNVTGQPYNASTQNVILIQSLLSAKNIKVSIEEFSQSSAVQEPICRMGAPIDVAAGETMAKYISESMQTELFMANAYDLNSDVVISGELTAVDFSSVSPASWNIELKVYSNKSSGYVVNTRYPFQTSYEGVKACQNVADAFAPAVQRLISDVINHPEFSKLTGQ